MNTVASLPDRLAMHARDCAKAADMDTDVVLSREQIDAMADDMAEAALALATPEQPGSAVQGEADEAAMEAWHSAVEEAGELYVNAPDSRYANRARRVKAWIVSHRPTPPPAPAATYATPDDVALTMGPDDIPHLLIAGAEVARFPKGSWAEVCEAFDFGGYRYEPPAPAAEQPEGKGAECSPGEPAPPPSTPAQHYLAAHNGCATQEWQDGFNTCASAPAAPVGVDELDASIIREAADLLTAVGDSGVQLPETWRWPLIDELHGIAALAGKAQEESNG